MYAVARARQPETPLDEYILLNWDSSPAFISELIRTRGPIQLTFAYRSPVHSWDSLLQQTKVQAKPSADNLTLEDWLQYSFDNNVSVVQPEHLQYFRSLPVDKLLPPKPGNPEPVHEVQPAGHAQRVQQPQHEVLPEGHAQRARFGPDRHTSRVKPSVTRSAKRPYEN